MGRSRRRPNRLLTVQRQLDRDDGHGGTDRAWVSIGEIWVAATPIGGTEAMIAGTLTASEKWRLECDYADLRSEDRLVDDAATLNIRSAVDPDGDRRRLVMFADTLPTG